MENNVYFSRISVWLIMLSALVSIQPMSGQEHFKEVGEAIGLGVTFSRGVSIIDYDQDGLDDIFITRNDRNNQLFRNKGDGTFEDVASQAALGFVGRSNQSVWADYDNDGDIDCYLTIVDDENILYQNQGDGTFLNVTEGSGLGSVDHATAAIWGDVNGDGLLDLFLFQLSTDDIFFLNNGDGTFTDYTGQTGIAQKRLTMGATFIDFDRDNDLDVYVSHDGHSGNFLYENDGKGIFTDVSEEMGIYTSSEAMGVSVGDFNNDGWPDLYLTNRLENFLFRNNEGTSFTEMAQAAAVDDPGMGWGVSWLDFDNDGLLDLYIANDSHYSDHPNVLYRNNGDETFAMVDEGAPVSSQAGSYATAISDLDHDGDIDVLVANRGNIDRAEFFINELENDNAWLVVRLAMEGQNYSGVGSQVSVITAEATYTRYVFSGTSWSADDSKSLNFGLGTAQGIEKVEVTWPDGTEQEFEGLSPNKAYTLYSNGDKEEMPYEAFEIQIDDSGTDPRVVTGLEEDAPVLKEAKVFPNPFTDRINLQLTLSSRERVQINLRSATSGKVFTLLDKSLIPGEHELELNVSKLTRGIYLLEAEVAGQRYFKKMVRVD